MYGNLNRSMAACVLLFVCTGVATAQLSGTKTINPSGSGTNNYTTFGAAINALNASGVGGTGVTFLVSAGVTFRETLQPITATGTISRPIVFERIGTGANPIVVPATRGMRNGTQFGNGDAVIQITGGDYITFDGIDAADDTVSFINHGRYEYGYLLRKANASNGCKHVTIRNCTVTLAKSNRYATGIMISNMVPTSVATTSTDTTAVGVTVANEDGRHESISIQGNTIVNALVGIGARGYNQAVAPFNRYDHFVEIGTVTGNTITGFGYGSTTAPHGIYAVYQDSMRIAYNTIDGGDGATTNCYGILATGSISARLWVENNTITVTSDGTTSSLIGLSVNFSGDGSRIDVYGNTISGCSYSSATSGALYGFFNAGAVAVLVVDSNRITNNSLAGTGMMYLLYLGGSGGLTHVLATRNTVSGNSKTGIAGNLYCVYAAADTLRLHHNLIGSNLHTVDTTAGYTYGYYNNGSPMLEELDSNRFEDLNGTLCYAVYSSTVSKPRRVFRGDTITALHGRIGTNGITLLNSSVAIVEDCRITNFTNSGGAYGLSFSGDSAIEIHRNQISNFDLGGAVGVWWNYTCKSITVTRNLIRDLNGSGVNSFVQGIRGEGGNATISNNIVAELYAPNMSPSYVGPLLAGISVTGTRAELLYNTVYLDGSLSGANASTAAVFVDDSTRYTAKNNIFINLAGHGSTSGTASAYRRYGSVLSSYDSSSNNNLYYVGTPSSTRLIFTDGTNGDQTLAAFRARVAPRDTLSLSGLPPFVNISTTPYDVHLDTVRVNMCESAGIAVAGITSDYDGQTRQGASGYGGTGTAPDIGADEGNFNRSDNAGPEIVYNPLPPGAATSTRPFTHVSITDPSGVSGLSGTRPRVYFKKSTETNALGNNNSASDGWKWVEATGTSSPYSFTIDYSLLFNGTGVSLGNVIQYFVVAQDSAAVPNVAINAGTFASAPASVALTTAAFPIGGTPHSYIIADTISGTVTIPGTYPSLTGSSGFFADMNNKSLIADLTVLVRDSLFEDGAVALNTVARTPATAAYTITIRPDTARVRVIHGSMSANAMLRLNGADHVSFDGRYANGGRYLRLVNAATAQSVLSFVNDASRNTVRNCIVEGRSSTAALLHIGAGTSTGNDSILVSENLFRSHIWSDSAHAVCIYAGASSSAKNSSTIIVDNELTDFSYRGVWLGPAGNGDDWTIAGNNFYRPRSTVVAGELSAIVLEDGGMGHIVHDNSIGGSDSSRGGAPLASSTAVRGIVIAAGNDPGRPPVSVQNNHIGNIASRGADSCILLGITGGKAVVGTVSGNVLGGGSNPCDTISVGANADLLSITSNDTVFVENNIVGHAVYTVGGDARLTGIAVSGSGVLQVNGNTISDLESNTSGLSVTSSSQPLAGMRIRGDAVLRIEKNTVRTIHNSSTTSAPRGAYGLVVTGARTGSIIRGNRVYDVGSDNQYSGVNAPSVTGIQILGGRGQYANNQVTLGEGFGYDTRFRGIDHASDSLCVFLHNTVVITGAAGGAATQATHAFLRSGSGTTRLRNNVFINGRQSSGWLDYHYAIGTAQTSGWMGNAWVPALTSNHQFLAARDTTRLADWAGTPLASHAWKTAVENNDVATLTASVGSPSSTSQISVTDLFPAVTTGNLAVDTTRWTCWFLNGNGIAGVESDTLDADIDGHCTRLRTRGYGTDLGSDEFGTSVTPPMLRQEGLLGTGQMTTYTLGGRTMLELLWGSSGTVPDSLHARVRTGTTPPAVTQGAHASAYWSIDAWGGSGYTYELVLHYTPAMLGSIAAEADARLARRSGGVWTHHAASTIDTVARTVRQGGMTAFSDFTLSDNTSPLPVELEYLRARFSAGRVSLSWSTLSELNALRYDVERRSTGGWMYIGTVPASGSSDIRNNYVFEDTQLPPAEEYVYRLRMVDRDGTFEYSSEVRVAVASAGFRLYAVYPNPFHERTTITFALPVEEHVAVRLYDAAGRGVLTVYEGLLSAGTHSFPVSPGRLPAGVYRCSVETPSARRTGLLLKVK
ncbi:MAG: right-handed parallel beta-helix repeat-containing protein [Ignavibacteriae bacterium]|nr:right-handed parallel beta-helix repeat-containing protein [Ignavibacteriota bacterium]